MRKHKFEMRFSYEGAHDRDQTIMFAALGSRRHEVPIMQRTALHYNPTVLYNTGWESHVLSFKNFHAQYMTYMLSGVEELEDYRDEDGYPVRFVHAQHRRMDASNTLLCKFAEAEKAEWLEQNHEEKFKYILKRMRQPYYDCVRKLNKIEDELKRSLQLVVERFDYRMAFDEHNANYKGVGTYVD